MNSDTLDLGSLAGAAGVGAVAGLRSIMAPLLVSQAANTGSIDLKGTEFEFLSTQKTADVLTVAAVLEIVMDKLPVAPDRIGWFGLAGRITTGALSGAAVCAARKKDWVPGAMVGAASAVAAAFAGYWLRKSVTEGAGAPDLPVALAEDALAISGGVLTLRNEAVNRPLPVAAAA